MAAPRVFVSHATADADFANRLSDDLRRLGADVWLDSSHMGAGDFVARINAALLGHDVVILILSPTAIQSPWVNQEVNAAITRERQGVMHPLIVVVAQHCTPSTIPPLWTVYHRYDATKDYLGALSGVARELGFTIARPQKPEDVPSEGGVGIHFAADQAVNFRRIAVAVVTGFALFAVGQLTVPPIRQFNIIYLLPRYLVLALADVGLSAILVRSEIVIYWQLQGRRPSHPWILSGSVAAFVMIPIAFFIEAKGVYLSKDTGINELLHGILLGVIGLILMSTLVAMGALAGISDQKLWRRLQLLAILVTLLFLGLTVASAVASPPTAIAPNQTLAGLTYAGGVGTLFLCALFGVIGSTAKAQGRRP